MNYRGGKMNPLLKLAEYGQSYWLDNLTRRKITSGELQRRIRQEGLRGITSNPAIFNKAISGSDDYNVQIRDLVERGLDVNAIYEALVVKDIQDACDILRPVYDDSDGVDGFVSLEVSPHLAHDTEGTMKEARRLFQSVNRPNVLIKIPGTKAGVPAIEEMLFEGVNVNVTLLFSIAAYEAVASAYIRAVARRATDGRSLHDVASVASFFLSRIDVLADRLLQERIHVGDARETVPAAEALLGKFAVASARLAYQSFKRLFSSEAWRALERQGARFQRLLWASTSTKNPQYSDVYYVEPLIGPHTVNTMPDETVDAFCDHGVVKGDTIERDLETSLQVLADLKKVGVDPEMVTQQLLEEGVQKFIDPFKELMKSLEEKRLQFV
jgi:transaldolase